MNRIVHAYKQFRGIVFFSYINMKRMIRKLLGKKLYYVIGDSHTLCFQHEYFKICHVGPSTAYKLNFKNSSTRGREKVITFLNSIYTNKPIDVIFVFGELDTRIHINKISNEKNIDRNNVINETVNFYMNFLKFIKDKFPLINIYVFNVLPQGEEENIYNFPFYAERKLRLKIVDKMNKLLAEYSKINNFRFIYIYNSLIDKNKNRLKKFVFDDVHFNRKIMPFVVNTLNNFE